jgi:hypothetical protein
VSSSTTSARLTLPNEAKESLSVCHVTDHGRFSTTTCSPEDTASSPSAVLGARGARGSPCARDYTHTPSVESYESSYVPLGLVFEHFFPGGSPPCVPALALDGSNTIPVYHVNCDASQPPLCPLAAESHPLHPGVTLRLSMKSAVEGTRWRAGCDGTTRRVDRSNE